MMKYYAVLIIFILTLSMGVFIGFKIKPSLPEVKKESSINISASVKSSSGIQNIQVLYTNTLQ